MVNGKKVVGIVMLIAGIPFLVLTVLFYSGQVSGYDIFGSQWYTLMYYFILVPFIGMILIVAGLIVLVLYWKKE